MDSTNIVIELNETITKLDLDEGLSLYDLIGDPDPKRPVTPVMQGRVGSHSDAEVTVEIPDSILPRTLEELVDLLDLPAHGDEPAFTAPPHASPHSTTFDPWDKWPI